MKGKKILIVDDERDIGDILQFNLHAAGYQAEAVGSAEDAAGRLEAQAYDLVILDVMMPGVSGFEFAKQLKADTLTKHIPIIFLTAKDTEDDALEGFSLGADDYVTKPFSIRELLARVKAVLKRTTPYPRQEQEGLRYEGLSIDADSKTVTIDGEAIALTRTEFDLLRLLLEHRGQLFNRRELLENVWPQDVIVTERTVDVNIARLRKKLRRYASCLVSRTGFGYCFETTNDPIGK